MFRIFSRRDALPSFLPAANALLLGGVDPAARRLVRAFSKEQGPSSTAPPSPGKGSDDQGREGDRPTSFKDRARRILGDELKRRASQPRREDGGALRGAAAAGAAARDPSGPVDEFGLPLRGQLSDSGRAPADRMSDKASHGLDRDRAAAVSAGGVEGSEGQGQAGRPAGAEAGGRAGIDRPYVAGDLDDDPTGALQPDPNYGYAILGLDDSQSLIYRQWRASQQSAVGQRAAPLPDRLMGSLSFGTRLNPGRSFKLAELYSPRQLVEPANELDPVLSDRALMYVARPVPSNADFAASAHIRNREFLRSYLSEGGKLPHRRVTHLKNKHQVRLSKAVKTARKMSLLPDQSKYPIMDE